jgi:mono/diheme cytochrome c family protein
MRINKLIVLFTLSVVTSFAYADSPQSSEPHITRWYTNQQAQNGLKIYQTHCQSCHQAGAEGSKNWIEKDESGRYPAPALNGHAHTYHHKLDNLRRVVREGGTLQGGVMPAFAEKLSHQQIDEVLAWVQSNWSDEIYLAWLRWSKQDR